MSEGYQRLGGWRMMPRAAETFAPLPEEALEPQAMRFQSEPVLENGRITYRVTNPDRLFDKGEVVDHLLVIGVSLEDGVEFIRFEDSTANESELWHGQQYDGDIELPWSLADGVYAAHLTVDSNRNLDPRPVADLRFTVQDGQITPYS